MGATVSARVVSCWQQSEAESVHMWKSYVNGSGVAIQSTFKLLQEQLAGIYGESKEYDVYVGAMDYLDYTFQFRVFDNVLSPLMCKRVQFQSEREVRAIVAKHPPCRDIVNFDVEAATMPEGVHIDLNLEKLITQVIVFPYAPNWFIELVNSLINKYKLNLRVTPSSLTQEPFFE